MVFRPEAILLVVSILLGSVGLAVTATSAAGADVHPSTGPTTAVLLPGPVTGTVPSTFWGVNLHTKCASCIASDPLVGQFLNQTPFIWSTDRFGTMSDQCNVTTNTQWSNNGVSSTGCAFNVTALMTWCYSFTPHCHVILTLPGENNNSAEDANIASYIVNTLGFRPDYWSIGNEPTAWVHYGIAWPSWRTADASTPTPTAYAFDVKAAITAVKAVDSQAKFVGIEAATQGNTAWFQTTVQVNGPSLSAVAYHSYPSGGFSNPTLTQFLAPLDSNNITSSYATVRADIIGQCNTCATLPIFVNEYNAGPGAGASSLGGTYSNAVFLAASIAQALRANVSMLTIFNLQSSSGTYGFSMMNSTGVVGPTGLLFSKFMTYMTTGTTNSIGVASTATSIWSVVETGASLKSLLVVNANITQDINVTIGTVFPTGGSGTIVTWATGQAAPTVTTGSIPGNAIVPSQGMLLLEISTQSPSSGGGGGGGGGPCIGIGCPATVVPPTAKLNNTTGAGWLLPQYSFLGYPGLFWVGVGVTTVGVLVLALIRQPFILLLVLAGAATLGVSFLR